LSFSSLRCKVFLFTVHSSSLLFSSLRESRDRQAILYLSFANQSSPHRFQMMLK
jgi:hypothetical protein